MSPRQIRLVRLIAAGLLAPIVGSAFAGVVPALFGVSYGIGGNGPSNMEEYLANLVLGAGYGSYFGWSFGAPYLLMLGLPIHVLLMRRAKRVFFLYAACGGAVGALGLAVLRLRSPWDAGASLSDGALGGWVGTCIFSAFWLIRRPDTATRERERLADDGA